MTVFPVHVNQAFRIKVANKLQILQDLQEDPEDSVESVEQVWEAAKKAWKESCEDELGIVKNQSQLGYLNSLLIK